jgi:hypothetical protein
MHNEHIKDESTVTYATHTSAIIFLAWVLLIIPGLFSLCAVMWFEYCLFSIRCLSHVTANCELSCQKRDVTPIFEVASWDVTPNIVGKSE